MMINLQKAISLLKQGQIIVVPTDTVYGLAASMNHVEAIRSLFLMKNRTFDNPLNLLISNLEQAHFLTEFLPPEFLTLADAFWPGALTFILPANKQNVPEIIRSGGDTIGLRMPNDPQLLRLISETGPLAVPSANKSGKPTSTLKEHIIEDFGEDIPILEGGCQALGIESTILAWLTWQTGWKVIRKGSISVEEIEKMISKTVFLGDTPSHSKRSFILSTKIFVGKGKYLGSPSFVVGFSGRKYPKAQKVYFLGNFEKPEEIAINFYEVLRKLEQDKIEAVWFDANIPERGIFAVILDRIERIAVTGSSQKFLSLFILSLFLLFIRTVENRFFFC